MPGTKLQEHSGSEKAWVYTTVDFADEEQKPELFCIRFASPESKRHAPKPDLQSSSMTLSPEALSHVVLRQRPVGQAGLQGKAM